MKIQHFNYGMGIFLICLGIFFLIFENNFLGIAYPIIGSFTIIAQYLVTKEFKRSQREMEEHFRKLREVLGIEEEDNIVD